jgi:N-acetylglutamate synthase-like GNAT family acetyltransferase
MMSAAAVQGDAVMTRRRLVAIPLAPWERDGVKAALVRTKLPADDVGDARVLVWRFETIEGTPVGFGGLEIFGSDALLRSLMTLPPLRQVGMGAAMVAMLEIEARALKCHAIYLLTASGTDFFVRLGYAICARSEVPHAVRGSGQFAELCPATALAMVKRLG